MGYKSSLQDSGRWDSSYLGHFLSFLRGKREGTGSRDPYSFCMEVDGPLPLAKASYMAESDAIRAGDAQSFHGEEQQELRSAVQPST